MVNQKAFMNGLLERRTRMEICSSKGVVGDIEMAECLPGACFSSHNLPSVSLTLFHPRYRVPVNECHPRQDMLQTSGGDLSTIHHLEVT